MADCILIFASDPGRVRAEVPVPMPCPRVADGVPFRQIVDEVYTLFTTRSGQDGRRDVRPEPIGIGLLSAQTRGSPVGGGGATRARHHHRLGPVRRDLRL